eukprot:3252403-Pyramimonas_sp.AAC.1
MRTYRRHIRSYRPQVGGSHISTWPSGQGTGGRQGNPRRRSAVGAEKHSTPMLEPPLPAVQSRQHFRMANEGGRQTDRPPVCGSRAEPNS